MKAEKLFPFAALLILLIAACDKDDDESNNSCESISYPYLSEYLGADEVDFRVFIGGQELNTADLNPEDFLISNNLENYNNIQNFDVNLIFTPDSLTISPADDTPRTYGYIFEDGKLIITDLDIFGQAFSFTLGYGSIDAFEIRNGFFTFCKPLVEWPFKDCEDQTSELYFYTLDSVSSELGLDDVLTEMEQNDTLAIYNYRYLFN
ncbi:MAG: hypothetical protein ACI8QH_001669 [Flammeovirgaceae bacterium]|jgi:hypothetical protein